MKKLKKNMANVSFQESIGVKWKYKISFRIFEKDNIVLFHS